LLDTKGAFLLRPLPEGAETPDRRAWILSEALNRLQIRANISPHGKNFLLTDGDVVTHSLAGGLASEFGFNVYRQSDVLLSAAVAASG